MRYAAGKRAWGICDRSGLRYPLKDLVPQYRNGVKTGLLVGRDQVDEDHPQNFIGRARTDDAQALRNPRPETTNGRGYVGWAPVGHPLVRVKVQMGSVSVEIS
jgi:hypothetical protein